MRLCHRPGCDTVVPDGMYACRPHWLALPQVLRDRVQATYRPRREADQRPSPRCRRAAQECLAWWGRGEAAPS